MVMEIVSQQRSELNTAMSTAGGFLDSHYCS